MKINFQIGAEPRNEQGKGASRRLRRAGRVPAVLYGTGGEPRNLSLNHEQLLTLIDNEKFYASIVSDKQPVIVRDVQMHPAKHSVVHVDLQRVVETEKLRIHLPIHFKNETSCPGVKVQGGIVSHLMQDVEVSCLPAALPEFLELDLGKMSLNDTLFLKDIPLPEGVTIPELAHRNPPVVSVHSPRVAEAEPEPAAAAAAEGAVAGAAPAGDAAKKDDAKKEDPKKDAGAKKDAAKK